MPQFREGDELPPVVSPPIRRLEIAYMTVAMRDPNPVHLDDEVGRAAGLPSAIAHGTFPLACLGNVITRHAGIAALQQLEVEILGPTFPGDRLECRGVVGDVESTAHNDVVTVDLTATNDSGALIARGRARFSA